MARFKLKVSGQEPIWYENEKEAIYEFAVARIGNPKRLVILYKYTTEHGFEKVRILNINNFKWQ